MAAMSEVSGLFVNREFAEWDSYTNKQGKAIAAGRRLTLRVYTPHDADLMTIDVDAKFIDEVLRLVDELDFGVAVKVDCSNQRWGLVAHKVERSVAQKAA